MPKSTHNKWGGSKTGRTTIRLTEDALEILRGRAKEMGVSLSEYLEMLARQPAEPGEQQA